MYQYRVHSVTISRFIIPVCHAIYTVLCDEYMKCPVTEDEWRLLINETSERWQFPNCFGAADGKHIGIICPKNSGSQYYNYKGFFSVVLMALVDYDYRFIYADVGCQGRINDGGLFTIQNFMHI